VCGKARQAGRNGRVGRAARLHRGCPTIKAPAPCPGKRGARNYFVTAKAGRNKTLAPAVISSQERQAMENQRHSSAGVSLQALVSRAERAGVGAPPVERWDPPFCGDIDMVIRRDGSWDYMGTPIGRPALVRLFSTVLRREADGGFVLVTPVEKLGITVEDAPFAAVEMSAEERDGEPVLAFRTNVGDLVEAGPEHPLRFGGGEEGGFVPYVLVRGGLEARCTRALAFDLADLIEAEGQDSFIRSNGARFLLPPDVVEP
jgi:uncharacterized protein